MTKSELLSRLDCREMDLRCLINDLLTDVQLMPGDEQSRALRHVCDTLGNALSNNRKRHPTRKFRLTERVTKTRVMDA